MVIFYTSPCLFISRRSNKHEFEIYSIEIFFHSLYLIICQTNRDFIVIETFNGHGFLINSSFRL